jgi:hypothetical protein
MDRTTGEVTGVLPADQGEWLTNVPMDLMANEHIWSLATDKDGAESIALFFREAGLGMDGTGHFTVAGTVYEVRHTSRVIEFSDTPADPADYLPPVTRSNQ